MAVRRQIRAFTIANDVSYCVDALHATILDPTAQGRGGLLAALNLQPPATSLPAESVDSFGLTAEARRQLQDLTNTQLVGRDLLDAAFLSPATRRRAREIFNAAQRDLCRQKRQQARSSSRRPAINASRVIEALLRRGLKGLEESCGIDAFTESDTKKKVVKNATIDAPCGARRNARKVA